MMQLGYSLLLREFAAATDVDYGDCEQFQITCPSCHEAIFKAGKFGHDRQYFSHYAASKSNVKQCELRVAAITQETIEAKNILGHGQSLELFFSRFRGFVVRWLYGDQTVETLKVLNWMASRQVFLNYASSIGKVFRVALKLRALLVAELEQTQTPYWMNRQLAFSKDFLDHLLAPNSISALAFMLALSLHMSILPDDIAQALHHAKNNQLQKFFEKLSANNRFESLAAITCRSFHFLLLLIPYVNFFADEPDDKVHRDLLFSLNNVDLLSSGLLQEIIRESEAASFKARLSRFRMLQGE